MQGASAEARSESTQSTEGYGGAVQGVVRDSSGLLDQAGGLQRLFQEAIRHGDTVLPAGNLMKVPDIEPAIALPIELQQPRARGRHRLRREPRACFGELLHLDGSVHAWWTLAPECLRAARGR